MSQDKRRVGFTINIGLFCNKYSFQGEKLPEKKGLICFSSAIYTVRLGRISEVRKSEIDPLRGESEAELELGDQLMNRL